MASIRESTGWPRPWASLLPLVQLQLLLLTVVVGATLASESAQTDKADGDCQSLAVPAGGFTKISQVRRLIDAFKADANLCPRHRAAYLELDGVVAAVESTRICNLELVELIRNYHNKFIRSLQDSDQKQQQQQQQQQQPPADEMPLQLRHFFVALCFQINAECKMALINNLEHDTREKITERDYETIKLLEQYGATLIDTDTELRDFDDIVFLSDLSSAASASGREQLQGDHDDDDHEEELKLIIKARTNDLMKGLIRNCQLKFKPFYDKLIMPLIGLSNLGYNYQGELLARELAELRQNKLVHRWYNIVQTCEAFKSMTIYEDTNKTLDNERQVVSFVSRAEARLLDEQQVPTIERELAAQADQRPLHYEPVSWHEGDELWIRDQRELEKLIRNYRASLSETDRIKQKIIGRLVAKIKQSIRSGQILFLTVDVLKCTIGAQKRCESSVSSVNEELIMVLDDAMAQNDTRPDGPVAAGPKSRLRKGPPIRALNYPARPKFSPAKRDGSKASTKLYNWTLGKILPSRLDMFFWFIGIVGILFCGLGIMLMAG